MVSALTGLAALFVAIFANKLDSEANKLAEQAAKTGVEANHLASEANQIAADANNIAQRTLTFSEDKHPYEWGIGFETHPSSMVKIVNDSTRVAFNVSVTIRCDGVTICESVFESVPAFGQCVLDASSLGQQLVEQEQVRGLLAATGGAVDMGVVGLSVVVYIRWVSDLGVTHERVSNECLRNLD